MTNNIRAVVDTALRKNVLLVLRNLRIPRRDGFSADKHVTGRGSITRPRIYRLVVVSLFACHQDAFAQPPEFEAQLYLPQLVAAERTAAGLPTAVYHKPRAFENFQTANQFSADLQALAVERANVGDTAGAIAVADLTAWPEQPSPAEIERLADAHAEEAIAAIVAQARDKRIVLLNEAHHVPLNRAFALRLARELRKIGFSYLACETFEEDASGNAQPRAPRQTVFATGYYTKEPAFAEFVNDALADGWTPIAYEDMTPVVPGADMMQILRTREQGQARNLASRIFARDRNARVLIYVGYAHLMKAKSDDEIIWMSTYLERSLGLSMLRVDQTTFFAHPDLADEDPRYAEMLARFPSTEPFVVRAAGGRYLVQGRFEGHVDMQIVFPRYGVHDGRPDWLRMLAGRNPRPIPQDLLPARGRRLIKAFRIDGAFDAVPIDNVLVEANKLVPVLMLPPGEYRYAVEDAPN